LPEGSYLKPDVYKAILSCKGFAEKLLVTSSERNQYAKEALFELIRGGGGGAGRFEAPTNYLVVGQNSF